jgi:hypothetical protein
MPEFDFVPTRPTSAPPAAGGLRRNCRSDQHTDRPLEARVKRECAALYPGVDPRLWYQVVLDGEYKDDMEGFWIQVDEWVTYVLAKHFDVQARPVLH